jgi:uncharacterized Ntn-hydrolase superfamily protein
MSERQIRQKFDDEEPRFTQSMAAAFFDLESQALKAKERSGYFVDAQGNPLEIHKTPGGERRYSLNDILRIAHTLRRMNKMTDRQLRLIVLRVDAFREPIKKHRKRYRKGNWTE